MFGVDQTMQNEPVINDAMETEALADVEMEAVDVAKEVDHVNDDILLLKSQLCWKMKLFWMLFKMKFSSNKRGNFG
jgi:hypothetical protein